MVKWSNHVSPHFVTKYALGRLKMCLVRLTNLDVVLWLWLACLKKQHLWLIHAIKCKETEQIRAKDSFGHILTFVMHMFHRLKGMLLNSPDFNKPFSWFSWHI